MNIFILAMVLLFAGCTKKPRITVTGDAPQSLTEESEVANIPDPNETIIELDPPSWTIYFDFDSANLREAYKAAALAEYLKTTGGRVMLSGHASEEGTEEYNLSLGHKRANEVKEHLESYGVNGDKITCVSFGEMNPVTTEKDKIQMNRRVEISIEGVDK